ncbi:hypothetical protein VTJ83DRAFT_4068 [Remersonia thermophila]|uniref:F-box domain-containing protein n=1 Tax=Remersonia thermophila TaxID=72144 RepID=A0ABR4DI11_9PEZI
MLALSDLPTELLDAIVTALCGDNEPQEHPITCCVHSWYEDTPVEEQPPVLCDRQRQASLRSLCLTSRRIYAVALPHLYHHLQPSSNWWRLVQTLAIHPHLASCVRSLRLDDEDQPPHDVESWVWEDPILRPLYEVRRAEYLEACPDELDEPAFGPAWEDGYEQKDDARRMTEFEHCFDMDHNLALSLLTSMLPNLETLVATVGFAVAFRFNKPGSLPRLRNIHLSPNRRQWTIDVRRTLQRLFAAVNESLENVILEYCSEHSSWNGRVYPAQRALDFQAKLREADHVSGEARVRARGGPGRGFGRRGGGFAEWRAVAGDGTARGRREQRRGERRRRGRGLPLRRAVQLHLPRRHPADCHRLDPPQKPSVAHAHLLSQRHTLACSSTWA